MTELLDFSFLDARHGWALGASCSRPGTCPSIAIRVTTDGGRTWRPAIPKERISPGDQTVGPVQFVDPLRGWVAAGPSSVYRTDNGGLSWHPVTVR
ncbi:MAG: hypothetical protein JOZ41_21145 [Chloroflexi bacterium]|nr:hypothetical protein [Chloroflexota bacterium]